jgi:hypothetical protein
MPIEGEKRLMELSPAFDRILEMAYLKKGSVLFFDHTQHARYIRAGDVLIYFGERGMRLGEYLRSLGHEIEVVNGAKTKT